MKKVLFTFLLLASVSLGFSSCGDDDNDNEKPVISDFEPAEGDSLQIGKAIHFEIDFSDNDKLASYKIDIHNNFNNHGDHSSVKALATDSAIFAFSEVYTDIAGQKNAHVHHHKINIPKEDPSGKPYRVGKYHFVVYCLDESGNESVRSHNVVLTYNEIEDHDDHDHDH